MACIYSRLLLVPAIMLVCQTVARAEAGTYNVWCDGLRYSVSAATKAATLMPKVDSNINESEVDTALFYHDLPECVAVRDSVVWDGVCYPVTAVAGNAFPSQCNVKTIQLPRTMTVANAWSMAGVENVIVRHTGNSEVYVICPFAKCEIPYPVDAASAKHRIQLTAEAIPATYEDDFLPQWNPVYYALGGVSHVFWDKPLVHPEILQVNTMNYFPPGARVRYYGPMTRDCSALYAHLPDCYQFVRGLGLWGADVTGQEEFIEVPVELNRLDPIVSVQCVLKLSGSGDLGAIESIVLNPERAVDHEAKLDGDRLVVNSPSHKPLNGCDGTLFTLRLPSGSYDLVLTDIAMTTTDGDVITQANDTIRVNGGANDYDISDVNTIINHMLGKGKACTIEINGTSVQMQYVSGGTFMMGDEYIEDGKYSQPEYLTPHQVTVSSFMMAVTETTQALWDAVMGTSNPGSQLHPAIDKTWDEWQDFIARLNELTGLSFRLPTEAEWEFAARGGNMTQGYPWSGGDVNAGADVGWMMYHTSGEPQAESYPVGMKMPNELGLYDMSGNVWELCRDWYGPYPATAQVDPQGPATGQAHAIRGGSCMDDMDYATVYYRTSEADGYRQGKLGLRLAMDAPDTRACDVTGDGRVDIADVNAVINIMLGRADYDVPTGNPGHDTDPGQ